MKPDNEIRASRRLKPAPILCNPSPFTDAEKLGISSKAQALSRMKMASDLAWGMSKIFGRVIE